LPLKSGRSRPEKATRLCTNLNHLVTVPKRTLALAATRLNYCQNAPGPPEIDAGQLASAAWAAAPEAIGTGRGAVTAKAAGTALSAKLLSTIRPATAFEALVSVSGADSVAPYGMVPLIDPPVEAMMPP